jgi:hypothetical protein
MLSTFDYQDHVSFIMCCVVTDAKRTIKYALSLFKTLHTVSKH